MGNSIYFTLGGFEDEMGVEINVECLTRLLTTYISALLLHNSLSKIITYSVINL